MSPSKAPKIYSIIVVILLLSGCWVEVDPVPEPPNTPIYPIGTEYCGDFYCDFDWEDPVNCPEDCPLWCGDGFCNEPWETITSCFADCRPRYTRNPTQLLNPADQITDPPGY